LGGEKLQNSPEVKIARTQQRHEKRTTKKD